MAPGHAQQAFSERAVPEAPRTTLGKAAQRAIEEGRYSVVINLDENRLYFRRGRTTLWSAPVGTGTGIRLITDDDDWDFSTPNGHFQIQYKERDPIWIAPDWYFVENNLPIPPQDDPSRYIKGTLGVAAVYISPHLAIHGTDRPDLIGQRVSHGCIRLENRYALRLYQEAQVGTEVIIVGGEKVRENARVVDLREGYDPSLVNRKKGPSLAVDEAYQRWSKLESPELLQELDKQLTMPERTSRWDEVAILLLNRGERGDGEALEALMSRAGSLPTAKIEVEWAALLVDAYRRAPVLTLQALSAMPRGQRRQAAEMIVEAAIGLYSGALDSPAAPWPTASLPLSLVPRSASRGWDSLTEAEREHRDWIRMASADN